MSFQTHPVKWNRFNIGQELVLGAKKKEVVDKMIIVLSEMFISGVETNKKFITFILEQKEF